MIERAAWPLMGGLATVLVVASLVGQILRVVVAHRQAHPLIDNLNRRIAAWWVIVSVFGLAVLAGQAGITLLFALASFAALREFIMAGRPVGAPRGRLLAGMLLAIALQYALAASGEALLFALGLPSVLLVGVVASRRHASCAANARQAPLASGLLICVYAISHIPALLALPSTDGPGKVYLLAFLIVVVQASDVLQYVWGKLVGRRPIAPRISPGKTLAGTLGGILSASLLGACLSSLTPFAPGKAALLALLITLLGFAGSLFLSASKRQRGIKDWGSLLPGHGGMLDRLDSLWLPAPVYYYLLRAL